jgi:3-oxoacyl-[acyl-carrier-protein] synthase II
VFYRIHLGLEDKTPVSAWESTNIESNGTQGITKPIMKKAVVITGMGWISSLGLNPQMNWEALLTKKNGIHKIHARLLKNFNTENLNIHPRDRRIMRKHSYMLIKCCRDAFHHSQLETSGIPGEDIGLFVGTGMIDYEIKDLLPAAALSKDPDGTFSYNIFFGRGYQTIFPLWPLSMINNICCCQAAIDLGIRGENAVYAPHADSCVQAVAEACNSLLEHRSKVVLVGGVSENGSLVSLTKASHSLRHTGSYLGEGCGILTLELLSQVKKRHIPPWGCISGYGFSFGKDEAQNGPTVRAYSQSMEHALSKAALRPSEIDLIMTQGNDSAGHRHNEKEAIHHVFTRSYDKVNIYSSKNVLGDTLAAAPAIDLCIGTYILRSGRIPEGQCASLILEKIT